jgi:hypothetical protein
MNKYQRTPSAIRRFLEAQSSAGLVLMAAAVVALVIANSPFGLGYSSILHAYLGPLSVEHWINDGLMALFFLLVGLEIKREVVDGQLSTWSRRILPGIAAAGGMIVPALIYLAFNRGPTASGWTRKNPTTVPCCCTWRAWANRFRLRRLPARRVQSRCGIGLVSTHWFASVRRFTVTLGRPSGIRRPSYRPRP